MLKGIRPVFGILNTPKSDRNWPCPQFVVVSSAISRRVGAPWMNLDRTSSSQLEVSPSGRIAIAALGGMRQLRCLVERVQASLHHYGEYLSETIDGRSELQVMIRFESHITQWQYRIVDIRTDPWVGSIGALQRSYDFSKKFTSRQKGVHLSFH